MGGLRMFPLHRRLRLEIPLILPNRASYYPHMRRLLSPRITSLANRARQRGCRPLSPHKPPPKPQRNEYPKRRARAIPNPRERHPRNTNSDPLLDRTLTIPAMAISTSTCLWPTSIHAMLWRKRDPELRATTIQVPRPFHIDLTHDNRYLGRAGRALEHYLYALH